MKTRITKIGVLFVASLVIFNIFLIACNEDDDDNDELITELSNEKLLETCHDIILPCEQFFTVDAMCQYTETVSAFLEGEDQNICRENVAQCLTEDWSDNLPNSQNCLEDLEVFDHCAVRVDELRSCVSALLVEYKNQFEGVDCDHFDQLSGLTIEDAMPRFFPQACKNIEGACQMLGEIIDFCSPFL